MTKSIYDGTNVEKISNTFCYLGISRDPKYIFITLQEDSALSSTGTFSNHPSIKITENDLQVY